MYWDKNDLGRAFAQLDRIERPARAYVKQLLDEYHAETRPQRYYDILIGYWLQWLMHAAVVTLAVPQSAEPLAAPIRLPVFPFDLDFTRRVAEDEHFAPLLRGLLRAQALESLSFVAERASLTLEAEREALPRRLVRRWLASLGNREGVLVCAPYFKCSALEWIVFVVRSRRLLRWDDLSIAVAAEAPVDESWRIAKARAAGAGTDLLQAVKRLAPLLLPVAYLEGFGELRRCLLRAPIGKPRAFYTANSLYYHFPFKLLAAEHHRTALLLGHQHGGSFGMELRHAPEEYEQSVCDRFYTWGWDAGNLSCARALSPPAFKRTPRRRRWQVMLCLGDFPKTLYRIQFFPSGEAAERTIAETLAFVQGLARIAPRRSVLLRPPPVDYGRNWLKQLWRIMPTARQDRFERKAIERFQESELVFHNYVSTGWLESIWLDVPTLAIYDPDVYDFRPDALGHVLALERCGLLHRTGAAAARLYAEICTDIGQWWRGAEFQRVRADFCRRFVRVRTDWQHEWQAEFAALLANSDALLARRWHAEKSDSRAATAAVDSVGRGS